MSHPQSEVPSDLGWMPKVAACCLVQGGAMRLPSLCSVTGITHLAHTQSSLNFDLQERVLALLCLLPAWFFCWEAD